MNLLVEGVFDIFHEDHRRYIEKCVKTFKEKNGASPACLKVNVMSNVWAHNKGANRPFFDEEIRKKQVANFIKKFKNIIPLLEIEISNKAAFEYLHGQELESKYPQYEIALCSDNKQRTKTTGFEFLEVSPLNTIHTSNIEERLLNVKNSSNNSIRKVGAVVVQNGNIIGEGVSMKGDETCPKCALFDRGEVDKARLATCNHPHAEILAIDSSSQNLQDAAIIVTTAPCLECAKYIAGKKIPLVVYLEDYIRVGNNENDVSGVQMLQNLGVSIRKAGI